MNHVLEDEIKHSDAEKMEMESKEVKLQAEISALKTGLASRNEHYPSRKQAETHDVNGRERWEYVHSLKAEIDEEKSSRWSK